jgi:HEAT repeat protein
VLAGAIGGACAAVLTVWFLGAHPGRTQGELDALRDDMTQMRVRHADALAGLDARLRALEDRPSAAPIDVDARAGVETVAAQLVSLRDALRLELVAVDAELHRLTTIVDVLAGGQAAVDPAGPLPEEDEPRFVVRSGDPDPGVRFSALVRLGRRRSDRSVQASLARLDDEDDKVVWIALGNLGAFREREAAGEIVLLLDHPSALVRQKAHATLVRLGAPADTGFDALDPPEVRELAAAVLRAWADE